MTNNIKELVKRHFNLVEATAEEAFAMIKSADGELELTYEGESLAEGLEIFVVTADGNVLAPDGEHSLEGGITIITKDGKIESIMETPAEEVEEEVLEEEVVEESLEEDAEEALEEHEDEEMEDEVAEELEEEVEEVLEDEVIIAVVEAVRDAVEEMTKEMKERMDELEGKYASFSSAPASEKTIASSVSKKSKKESYKNQSRIDEIIARKKN